LNALKKLFTYLKRLPKDHLPASVVSIQLTSVQLAVLCSH